MNIKHVVLTKFLSKKMNLTDILEDEMLDYRLNLLKRNLFATLNNQTNKNFELVLLTNPELPREKVEKIRKFVDGVPNQFGFKTVPHDTAMDDYLGSLWNGNDFVIVSRIDDDDFADKDCVKRVQDFASKLTPGGQEQIQVLGYNKGYMYIDWMKHLGKVDFGYGKSGHVGIFQTFIYDTSTVKYDNKICPYVIGHELVRKLLNEAGFTAKAHLLDSEDGEPKVMFFLHKCSDSLYRETAKKHKLDVVPIDMTRKVLDGLVSGFGFPNIAEAVVSEQIDAVEAPVVESEVEEQDGETEIAVEEEPKLVVDEAPKEFKWYAVPPKCLYGRIDNIFKNYHRLDLNGVPSDEEHMAKILHYTPGISFVFSTKSKKITFRYKAHYYMDTYNLPLKSSVEPIVLGLDEYGVWNMINYIRVFTPKDEKRMKTDMELQFSVGALDNRPAFDPMDYVKYQVSFPTKATMLEFSIGADQPVDFETPPTCDMVFIGSSVAQDNYSSNHMNICPYLYREYGLNCATLGVSQYHTFRCSRLMARISKLDIPCVLMDVLHIQPDDYAKASKLVKNLHPFIIYKDREEVNKIIRENGLGMQDLVVMPGDCMWDSVHINDYGTVFYCQQLKKRGIPGIKPFEN